MSTKTSFKDRFFAALLSFMLIVSMIPLNAITAYAATEDYPENFTVTVKDSGDNAIAEATINYSIKVDGRFSNRIITGIFYRYSEILRIDFRCGISCNRV